MRNVAVSRRFTGRHPAPFRDALPDLKPVRPSRPFFYRKAAFWFSECNFVRLWERPWKKDFTGFSLTGWFKLLCYSLEAQGMLNGIKKHVTTGLLMVGLRLNMETTSRLFMGLLISMFSILANKHRCLPLSMHGQYASSSKDCSKMGSLWECYMDSQRN